MPQRKFCANGFFCLLFFGGFSEDDFQLTSCSNEIDQASSLFLFCQKSSLKPIILLFFLAFGVFFLKGFTAVCLPPKVTLIGHIVKKSPEGNPLGIKSNTFFFLAFYLKKNFFPPLLSSFFFWRAKFFVM